jgi:hypothetical protein
MVHDITDLARKSSVAPKEAESEVVAAISSAEGSANLLRSRRHGVGLGLPLLALVAGAALGYSGVRWFGPASWRAVPQDPWQRLTDALRPILEAASRARIPLR